METHAYDGKQEDRKTGFYLDISTQSEKLIVETRPRVLSQY